MFEHGLELGDMETILVVKCLRCGKPLKNPHFPFLQLCLDCARKEMPMELDEDDMDQEAEPAVNPAEVRTNGGGFLE